MEEWNENKWEEKQGELWVCMDLHTNQLLVSHNSMFTFGKHKHKK